MTEISNALSRIVLEGPSPTQIVRVEPGLLTRLLARATDDRPFLSIECDPIATQPADRLALYEASTGRGVVALTDVHSTPAVHDDSVAIAWCVVSELAAGPSRQQLVDGGLESAIRRARPVAVLRDDEQAALAALLAPLPGFATNSEPVPDEPATMKVRDVDDSELWASEKEMQLTLAADPQALSSLGLPSPPECEERFDGGRMRFDLSGPGVIVECKLFGTRDGVDQLQRYLEARRRKGGTWRGHLVVGFGYTRDVAVLLDRMAEEADREDSIPEVELTLCLKRPGGGVLLLPQEIDSIATPTVRDQVLQQLALLLHGTLQMETDARELALAAGLDPEQLLDELDNEDADELPEDAPEIEDLPLDDQPPAAFKEIARSLDVCDTLLYTLATDAGVPEDALEDVEERHSKRELDSAGSPLEALKRIALAYEELLPLLVNYATACGLSWGEIGRLRRELTSEEMADLGDLARSYFFARTSLDMAVDASVPLALAAGLSATEVDELTSEALALTGFYEVEGSGTLHEDDDKR